jgi:hypothetical protein
MPECNLADPLSAIAARAALRRKKQHEHSLEQTTAQISTLEQQIYSIEAANINRETLAAMERAGEAMQQIHGKLNIDKVDETMYVFLFCEDPRSWKDNTDKVLTGRNFENNMPWAKKLPMLLQVLRSASLSMNRLWMMSLQSWNRSSLITRC